MLVSLRALSPDNREKSGINGSTYKQHTLLADGNVPTNADFCEQKTAVRSDWVLLSRD